MTAGNHDYIIYTGETWSSLVAASDSSDVHIDHTGYTVEMDVRVESLGSSELLTLTTANSRITIDGNGDILLALTSAETAALTFNRGVYDLRVTSPGGTVNFYLRGNFLVQNSVTR